MQQLNLITSSNKTIMYDQYCKMLIGHPYMLSRIISCFVEEANVILKEVEEKSEFSTEKNFQIKDVIYRQWKQDYYTDKIQVLNNFFFITLPSKSY